MPENLSLDELVAVNSLLIERETCLADLSHIEATIEEILGQPFPFAEPSVTLPSTRARKRPLKPNKIRRNASEEAPRIRRLRPEESAYRVTLLERGEQKVIELLDFAPFQHLLDNPLPHTRIVTITTLNHELRPVATLLDKPH